MGRCWREIHDAQLFLKTVDHQISKFGQKTTITVRRQPRCTKSKFSKTYFRRGHVSNIEAVANIEARYYKCEAHILKRQLGIICVERRAILACKIIPVIDKIFPASYQLQGCFCMPRPFVFDENCNRLPLWGCRLLSDGLMVEGLKFSVRLKKKPGTTSSKSPATSCSRSVRFSCLSFLSIHLAALSACPSGSSSAKRLHRDTGTLRRTPEPLRLLCGGVLSECVAGGRLRSCV